MPATSRKQYRFMKAVENGAIKDPNLTPEQAAEFTEGQKYQDLPKDNYANGGMNGLMNQTNNVVNTGQSLAPTRKQVYAGGSRDPFSKLRKKLRGK